MALEHIEKSTIVAKITPVIVCWYCSAPAITRDNQNHPLCRGHYEDQELKRDREWLYDQAIITKSMTRPEELEAMARYRKATIESEKPTGLFWASSINAKFLSGEKLSSAQIALAKAVLKTEWRDE